MKVSSKLLNTWSAMRTRGDLKRLISYTEKSKPTIIKALKHGEASEKVILKISRFYSEKEITTPEEIELQALNLFSNGKGRKTY